MDMKLLHLAIDNFKGCQHQNLNFQGRSASIYGDNATGKTTIYDAFAWLLFGKDGRGRGDFEIKPLDPSGKVVDHAAVTAVEAILEVDGVPFQLRRAYGHYSNLNHCHKNQSSLSQYSRMSPG